LAGKQFTLILSVLLFIGILFYLGYKSSVAKTSEAVEKKSEFNFQSYLEQSRNKIPAELKSKFIQLEKNSNDQVSLFTLTRMWDSLGYPFLSAHYAFDLAQAEPNKENWKVAGMKFYNTASISNDSNIQSAAASKAEKALEKVLTYDSTDEEAKNALGILYIQIDKDIMKGVKTLKEIITSDSNNIQAIFTLGMLSIQSGQLDKAEVRFLKLISLEPFNPDYYYYLAEVYAKSGDKEKALKSYETCKSLLKDNKAKKEIEALINQLKNT